LNVLGRSPGGIIHTILQPLSSCRSDIERQYHDLRRRGEPFEAHTPARSDYTKRNSAPDITGGKVEVCRFLEITQGMARINIRLPSVVRLGIHGIPESQTDIELSNITPE